MREEDEVMKKEGEGGGAYDGELCGECDICGEAAIIIR